MRKPDDDLKIDISEIFGGEITPLDSPSEALSESETGAETAASDSHYQAFIEERNRLLEAKTAEIESSPPSMIASVESETEASVLESERVSLPPMLLNRFPKRRLRKTSLISTPPCGRLSWVLVSRKGPRPKLKMKRKRPLCFKRVFRFFSFSRNTGLF